MSFSCRTQPPVITGGAVPRQKGIMALGSRLAKRDVPDQVRILSQLGTSFYMAYAMQELTQRVPIWLKKFLLGPIVN